MFTTKTRRSKKTFALTAGQNMQLTKFIKNCVLNNITFPYVEDGEIVSDIPPLNVQDFRNLSNEDQGKFLDNLETRLPTREAVAKGEPQTVLFSGTHYTLTFENAVKNLELLMQAVDKSDREELQIG